MTEAHQPGREQSRPHSETAKTSGLLAALVVHNPIYPLSAGSGVVLIIFYTLYDSIFVVGTWLLTSDIHWRVIATMTGLAAFVAGMVNPIAVSSLATLAVHTVSQLSRLVGLHASGP